MRVSMQCEHVLGVLCARRCHNVLYAHQVCMGVEASCVQYASRVHVLRVVARQPACAWVSNRLEGEGGLSRACT